MAKKPLECVPTVAEMCFFFHAWTVWETTRTGNVVNGKFHAGSYVEQSRFCLRCGKIQLRQVDNT